MIVGRVKGHIVATAKVENLEGEKLLVVEILSVASEGLKATNLHMVCLDAVQAGEGEVVIVVQGSSARTAIGMEDVPVDALIVGIVDNLNAFGQSINREEII
tara:strand:+ start:738 stop:1043 length:306 start_codon:yes stop_codon:yes gene_type:complete